MELLGVRWANLFVDGITATDQITATGFTGTLDGILGSGTPAAATVTTIDASGVATATTFEPDGDTSAGDNAAIGYTSAEGLILTGQGSTSDITFKNDADGTVFTIPTGSDDVLFADDAKVIVGTSSDGWLVHDGSHTTLVDNGTGNLTLKSNGAGINFQKGDSETMCAMVTDGGVTLYFDNAAKLVTVTGGVNVTGELEADSLDIDGVAQIDGNITVGVDDTGYDVKFFGATSGSYMLWDESFDDLYLVGDARMGIGTTDLSLFNSVGGTIALAVCGESSSTAILGNTGAAMAIVNTDTTASNTAGLHFARADTDNTPNYAGASIVAQFGETQATGQYPSASLSFLTSSSQNAAPSLKMTLTAAGLLGIGVVPSHSLQVAAGADTDAMYLDVNGNFFITSGNVQITNPDGAGQSALVVNQDHATNVAFFDGSGGDAYVRTDGDLENTNNSYGAISDRKLKKNIAAASSQWDDVKALAGMVKNFEFKGKGDGRQIGFIAQDVQGVSPGLVKANTDRDADGNSLETETLSVKYSVAYMKAFAALGEALGRIETLETRIAALEG